MVAFGIVIVVLAVAGLFVPGWFDLGPPWEGLITIGSIVVLALAGLILLGAFLVFLWDEFLEDLWDDIEVEPLSVGLGIGLLGVAGLVAGAFIGLPGGWDPSLNVTAMALLATGVPMAVYGGLHRIDARSLDEDEKRALDAAIVLAPMAAAGVGIGVTLIVTMASFDVWAWLWMVLVLLTVIAFCLALPGIGYFALWTYDEGKLAKQATDDDDVLIPAAGGTVGLAVGVYLITLNAGLPIWLWLKVLLYIVAVLSLIGTVVGYGVALGNTMELTRRGEPASAVAAGQPATVGLVPNIAESLTRLAASSDRVYALLPRRRTG